MRQRATPRPKRRVRIQDVTVTEEAAVDGKAVLRAAMGGDALYLLGGDGPYDWRVVQRWGEGETAGEEVLLSDADRPTARMYAAIVLHCVTGWEPSGRFQLDHAEVRRLFHPWYGRHAETIGRRRDRARATEEDKA